MFARVSSMLDGMLTAAAARSSTDLSSVVRTSDLEAIGITRSAVRAHLAADRWQRVGAAIVLHNHDLAREEQWEVARVSCGRRAALTAFTAAESLGLQGFKREPVHVLVPTGTHRPRLPGITVRLHYATNWRDEQLLHDITHRLAPAIVRAATTYRHPRPATGLIAAAVQQRLVRPDDLAAAFAAHPRARHSGVLRLAVADISQGAQALSEIDFVQLCRRHGLPEPRLQEVRRDPFGRRRYLDASWRRSDGRLVAVEVDGAVHLLPRVWFDDQLRQNELVLADTLLLRFPSIIVRTEERMVADQLRRALQL